MRGIKLKSGTVFVKRGRITMRCLDGEWGISPITLEALKWELDKEAREDYDYLPSMDLEAAIGTVSYAKMLKLYKETVKILK